MRRHPTMAVMVLLLLSGCGADVTQAEAAAAAVAFVQASPKQQCDLLAPETRNQLERRSKSSCEKALAVAHLSSNPTVEAVQVAGLSARVRLQGQAIFLARFPAGWLVTAAGCVRTDPDPDVPYECEVEP